VTVEAGDGTILGRDADAVAEGVQAGNHGGIATVRLSPATAAETRKVRAFAGDAEGEGEIRFDPELRRWVVAGLGEAGWSANGSALRTDQVTRDPSARSDASARLALFARGRISEKDLLSFSYDTGRDRHEDELFRQEDPTAFFPVYGDASAQAHTLESQGKFAARWERDRSMGMYGDFRTGLSAAELTRYDRPLSGALAHIDTPKVVVHAFGATTPQISVRDAILADGSSGPYRLSRRSVVAYSERVVLEVRDRFRTERVLGTTPQRRFSDYDIDYEAGTILFRSPVASQDLGFNPVTIVVTFEVADGAGSNLVAGGRVGYRPSARFEVGTTAVREERLDKDFFLTGMDLTVRPWLGAAISAEYAQTSDATGRSGAYALKFNAPAGENVSVVAYLRSIPEDYSNPSMSGVSEIGTRKSGLEMHASLPDGSRLKAEAFRQEHEVTGMSRGAAGLGWKRPAGPVTWEAEGRALQGTEAATGEEGHSGLLGAGVRARLTPRLEGSLHRDEVVAGETVTGYPTRTTVGSAFRINDRMRTFLKHERDEGELQDAARTLLGVEGALGNITTVESRYALEDALSGERGYATLGVRARLPLNDLWTADLRAERSQTFTGLGGADFTAFTAGAEYLPGKSKFTSRYEARFGELEDRHLLTTAGALKLSPDMILFARNQLNLSQPELGDSRLDVDGLMGLAYRPVSSDRWNWLGRLEATRGESLPGGGTSLATAPSARGLMGVFEMNYQPVRKWHLLGRYAGRYSKDAFAARSMRVYTEVWESRTMFDVGKRVTAGVAGRLLRQPATGTDLTGVGLESGLGAPAARSSLSGSSSTSA
jgi:hypothetical protein